MVEVKGEGVRDVDGDDERCGGILLKLFGIHNCFQSMLVVKMATHIMSYILVCKEYVVHQRAIC